MSDKNIYWKDVLKDKIAFFEKGMHYETIDGSLIFWHGTEAIAAQKWLKKNKSITEIKNKKQK